MAFLILMTLQLSRLLNKLLPNRLLHNSFSNSSNTISSKLIFLLHSNSSSKPILEWVVVLQDLVVVVQLVELYWVLALLKFLLSPSLSLLLV